jgi:hypothetical protein
MDFLRNLFGKKESSTIEKKQKKCDVCSEMIEQSTGYLLKTQEMLQSDKYIEQAVFLHIKAMGMNPVMLMATEQYESMERKLLPQVKADIGKVTTPWLVCEKCIDKYFYGRKK